MDRIEQFLKDNAGIASVSELAALIDESEGRVRAWARGNPGRVRRLGATFAFTLDAVNAMLTDFAADAAEMEDEEVEGGDPEPVDVAWARCTGEPATCSVSRGGAVRR